VIDEPMLSVSRDDANPEITVLQDCSIRWSTDTSTWCDMGPRQAGHVFRDAASTPNNPRSYMATDGVRTQCYWSRGAGMAFADMMEPWIPTRVNPEFLIEFSSPHPTEGNPVGPFSSEKAAKRWARANAPEGAGCKVREQRW